MMSSLISVEVFDECSHFDYILFASLDNALDVRSLLDFDDQCPIDQPESLSKYCDSMLSKLMLSV